GICRRLRRPHGAARILRAERRRRAAVGLRHRMSAVEDLIAWLAGGCRSARANAEVMTELCERLVACGVPLARGALFIRTLHPETMGQRVLWKAGEGTSVTDAKFEYLQ